jgi:hypothetical protein
MSFFWKFWTLAGLESKPQAQMAMSVIHKTFVVLIQSEKALTCSILKTGTQVMFLGEGPG